MSPAADQPALLLDAEEQARANFYALLARLFYAPADNQVLRGIATSDDGRETASDAAGAVLTAATRGSADASGTTDSLEQPASLDAAWQHLVSAAAIADAAMVADEYQSLFVGSGRSEISLYVGAYTARSSVDSKLVALREFLASHGIQRQAAVHEPEDHIAMLFEVMRYLICEQQADIDEQKSFFDRFVWSGGIALCDAIRLHARAHFFASVALFAKSFLLIEHDAFEM